MTSKTNKAAAEADRDLEALLARCNKFCEDAPGAMERAVNDGDFETAQKIKNALAHVNETMGMIRWHGFQGQFGGSKLIPKPHHDVRSDSGQFSKPGSSGHFLGALANMDKAVDQPVGTGRPGLQLIASKKNPQVRRWQGQPKIHLGVTPRGVHQKLVDAKPYRPLTGQGTGHISRTIPGARHVPYAKVPGLDRMHDHMGASTKTDFKEYEKARDRAFNNLPTQKVPLKNLTYTQDRINHSRAKELSGIPEQLNKPVQVLKHGGEHYLMNGHHRVAAQHLAGQEHTDAKVLDLDKQPTGQRTWNVSEQEAQQKIEEGRRIADEIIDKRGLNDEFAKLRAHLQNGKSTKDMHSEGGQYTQDRLRLHNRIIDGMLHGTVAQAEPRVIYMGGLPGSGKSTVVKRMNTDGFVKIDSDEIKQKLPEYEGWNAALLQDEATDIVNRLAEQALAGRRHILIDCTLKSGDQYVGQIAAMKTLGYKVGVVYTDLPPEIAMDRAIDRYKHQGRFVDPRYIATHDHKNRASFERLKQLAHFYAAYDNNVPKGSDPKLLEKRDEQEAGNEMTKSVETDGKDGQRGQRDYVDEGEDGFLDAIMRALKSRIERKGKDDDAKNSTL
jgi:predicted ABC-type ATPase